MTTTVYLSDGHTPQDWVPVQLPVGRARDTLRGWLAQHLNVQLLGPLPTAAVPQALRPDHHEWTAIAGCTTTHADVLVITDDHPIP